MGQRPPNPTEPPKYKDGAYEGEQIERNGKVWFWNGTCYQWPEPPKNAMDMGREERITNATTGGVKGQKPERFDLVPVYPQQELARVYHYGTKKYAARNWERGYDWSLSYAAAERHIKDWWSGVDKDPDSGLHPLAHAAFHLFAGIEFGVTHPELDDRPSTLRVRAFEQLAKDGIFHGPPDEKNGADGPDYDPSPTGTQGDKDRWIERPA